VTSPRLRFGWIWLLLGAAYFVIPVAATVEVSLKEGDGYTFSAYSRILDDPAFGETLFRSLWLALATVLVSLALLVPAVYWVHLHMPRGRPALELVSALPLVVVPIVLIAGLLYVYDASWLPTAVVEHPGYLVPAYVVLTFPFMFMALDASFRAADVRTLTEAARSLGARRRTTIFRVVAPNVSRGAITGGFLTFALVMSEFTMASLARLRTFPVYVSDVGESGGNAMAALATISFAITVLAVLGFVVVGGRPGRNTVHVGGAR
jgi:putative spermidine/putrescine transport system permease protein